MEQEWYENPACYYFRQPPSTAYFKYRRFRDFIMRELESHINIEDYLLPSVRQLIDKEKDYILSSEHQVIDRDVKTVTPELTRKVCLSDLPPKTKRSDWQTHRNERKR